MAHFLTKNRPLLSKIIGYPTIALLIWVVLAISITGPWDRIQKQLSGTKVIGYVSQVKHYGGRRGRGRIIYNKYQVVISSPERLRGQGFVDTSAGIQQYTAGSAVKGYFDEARKRGVIDSKYLLVISFLPALLISSLLIAILVFWQKIIRPIKHSKSNHQK